MAPSRQSRRWPCRLYLSINLLVALPIISIYLQALGGQLFASSTTTSTPYPDANARPTITTKLENLSGIFKLSSMNITTTTEGYPNLFSDNDTRGNEAFCCEWRKLWLFMDFERKGAFGRAILHWRYCCCNYVFSVDQEFVPNWNQYKETPNHSS